MSNKHTPGPWTFIDTDDRYLIGAPGQNALALAAVRSRIAPTGGRAIEKDEAKANAHLIAAAPDLLNALKELMLHESYFEARSPLYAKGIVDRALAAIAKAEGEG